MTLLEWRPIESVRGDARGHSRVLLWCSDMGPEGKPVGTVMGRIWEYEDRDISVQGESMLGDWTFTHWMPLPRQPETTEKEI